MKPIKTVLDKLNERSTSAPGEISLGDRIAGIRAVIWTWFGQVVGFVAATVVFVIEASKDPTVAEGLSQILRGLATTGGMLAVVASLLALLISYRAEVARKKQNDNRGPGVTRANPEETEASPGVED